MQKTTFALNPLGTVVWEDRYGLKDENGQLVEKDILQTFARVAKAVASKEKDPVYWEEKFFNIMAKGYYCPAGRILAHAGTHYSQLLNCFVLPFENDSLEEIMKTNMNMAVVQKFGGVLGMNFTSLRPSGCYIKGVNGRSCGIPGFIHMMSTTSEVIEQGGCLTEDTLINTVNGLLYLHEIVKEREQGWYDHDIQVKTKDGVHASHRYYVNGYSDILKIRTDSGVVLKGTLSHKLEVLNKDGYAWKEFKDVCKGDWVVSLLGQHEGSIQALETDIPKRHHNCIVPERLPSELTEDFAFFLGYFLGNGFSTVKEGDHRIGVTIPEKSYLNSRIRTIYKDLFGSNIEITEIKKPCDKSTTYYVSNRMIKEYLSVNGLLKHRSVDATIPLKIRQSSVSIIGHFLAGLFEADGALCHGFPMLTTTSEVLAREVQTLLFGIGSPCTISKALRSLSSFSDTPMYRVRVVSSVGLDAWNACVSPDPLSRFMACRSHKADLSREQSYILPHSSFWLKSALESLPVVCMRASGLIKPQRLKRRLQRYIRGDRNLTISSYNEFLKEDCLKKYLPAVESRYFSEVTEIRSEEAFTFDIEVDTSHSYTANSVISHNSRRGASIGILEVHHPDVWEYISYKREHNWDTLESFIEVKDVAKWDAFKFNNQYKWQMFNVSVGVDAKFFEALKKNDEWVFQWNGIEWKLYTISFIKKTTSGDIVTEFEVTADSEKTALWKVKRQVPYPTINDKFIFKSVRRAKASEVWERICYNAWADGCPGLLNMSEIRRMHNIEYANKFLSVNPCLHGGSLLLTDRGLYPIKSLVGKPIRIWNGDEWADSTVFKSGVKPVYEMHLSNGMRLKGTLDHRVFSGGTEIQLGNTLGLNIDRMPGFEWVGTDVDIDDDTMVSLGFMFGDGSYHKASNRYKYVHLGEKDSDVEALFLKIGEKLEDGGREDKKCVSPAFAQLCEAMHFPSVPLYERVLPDDILHLSSRQLKLFLKGLFSANGSVHSNRVSLKITCKESAERIQIILMAFGIQSYITTNKAHEVKFSNGTYMCKESYDLNIGSTDVSTFQMIGFVQGYKTDKLKAIAEHNMQNAGRRILPTVVFITEIGEEEVYDFTELKNHFGFVDGLKVHNCGEQPLSKFGSCNLSSIILPAFVDLVAKTINYDKLREVVNIAVRFADNVIDNCDFPLPEIKETAMKERRVGIGTMGVHDMLILLEKGYDTEEGRGIVGQVLECIRDTAYEASVELAKERGPVPFVFRRDYEEWLYKNTSKGTSKKNCYK